MFKLDTPRRQQVAIALAAVVIVALIVVAARGRSKDPMCSRAGACTSQRVAARPDREVCDGRVSAGAARDLAHVSAAGSLDADAARRLDALGQTHLLRAGRGPVEFNDGSLSANLARRAAVREGMTGDTLNDLGNPSSAGLDALIAGDVEVAEVCTGSACSLLVV